MKEFFWPLPSNMYNIPSAAATYSGHGRNKLDFGAPKGTPIYSMTSGVVDFCGLYTDGVSACVIRSQGYGNLGGLTNLYIRYLHGEYNVKTGDTITQGQQIGTVSDVGSPGSFHLHLDFQPDRGNSGIGELPYGSGADQTAIARNMAYWNAQAPGNNYAGYCWQVIGNPAHERVASSYVPGSSGGTALRPTCEIPNEYMNTVFSDRFMAGGANSAAIKALAYSSTREFGFGDEGKSYGKLFRAWILYEVHRFNDLPNFRAANATIDTFARYWSGLTGNKWGCYTCYGREPEQDSQALCEAMYNNIRYPDIYGVTTPYCLEAMSNCPFHNETVAIGNPAIPSSYQPLVFSVVKPYNGSYYVMYRSTKSITQTANPAVFN